MDREAEMKMFGGLRDDMIEANKELWDEDKGMLAMSILSDAQEELSRGHAETARQYMNRAKFVISAMRARDRDRS